MEATSPPLTPIRQYMSPLETSPTYSYREQLRRRSSSFSSNHNRSPTSIRKNRFSNASQISNDFTPDGGGASGTGNLADELDQLDDEEEYEDDVTDAMMDADRLPSPVDGARDSGIDVSYSSKRSSPSMRNFSKPFSIAEKPPDERDEEEQEERLPPDLEEALNNIARMTSYTSTSEDPLIPRAVALLQDLGNQSTLETHAQRLATSTNSMTSHLTAQSKSLQALVSTVYSPLSFSASIDPSIAEETLPLIEELIAELPAADSEPLKGMQKLDRYTHDLIQTLSTLTDTLQMGKQTTNAASRHLRTTQTIVAELRRERERADVAREELKISGWSGKIRERWCASECDDIMAGFEKTCDGLWDSLVEASCA